MLAFRGYHTPHFRIVQRRNRWFALSGVLIVLALAGLFARGLNYSIDFLGGSLIQYENAAEVSVEEVREVLAQDPYDRADAEIQIVDGDQIQIRTTALTDLTAIQRTQLVDELAAQAGVDPSDVSTQVVGPTWGAEITRQALIGLVVVLVAIAIYVTFRFEWKMAVGALVAMLHDVLITAGVYALTGRQVSPATVIAILTILGFSLYDTVVIYDKVKENVENPSVMAKDTYEGVANLSMNQVLMRSVNTSLVVVIPILSLLLFGGETLKDFAFAMLIGVITGAYSSIFIATPILVILKEREPKYRQHRARLEGRPGERRLRPVPAAVAEPALEGAEEATQGEPAAVGVPSSPRTGSQSARPRSRKKPPAKRKRR
jgi:preprotein translocase subunit SecF